MARTRASKATSKGTPNEVESTNPKDATSEANKLPPPTTNPPKLFILPKAACPSSSCVVSLLHPRYGKPARYLICPETGLYEFTRIAPPKSNPRSWLLEPTPRDRTVTIAKDSDLHIATRIDPLFILLPIMFNSTVAEGKGKDSKRMFLSLDHHLETLAEDNSAHMSKVLASEKVRILFEGAMRRVCDSVEAGDESMFRLNETKLLECLLEKARRLADPTLPLSMEDKFVTSVLAAPVSNTPSSCPAADNGTTDETNSATEEAKDAEEHSAISTTQPSPEIIDLQRRKVAFNFICSSYVSAELTKQLNSLLVKSKTLIQFAPLEEYLKKLAKLKQETLAARSVIDYTRKRGLEDDDEAAEKALKRRKKEEEEKRKKAGESRGVKNLKKVNVTGMKKMSDFFKKKT